ncbi:alpha-ketoacid dehydrogenase subunit alpha/beta [Nocardioides sp. YIM 152315]|uniref:alpha-ketoacid dehydrogenase subunit alpha/beta n=1 Tax=Nocardioides sp. YIM 152315 TaxID=3031760 RepID=UPI0023D9F856|nr:alpha-ketoacid dehydrogenase subunit alpha/beta [Nocardioides sp. YIM 152315]MDF1603741.1 thiamine pyrophosphate-dependent enzyme [Nocardioides sp. YIM 152315]
MNDDELLAAYERMCLIRHLEVRVAKLYAEGAIPGFVHTSVGQEASAVGALWHARADDAITSTHRGHGHVLAKGLSPRGMIAELMGKEAGACRGRGGSMHVADPALGILGANGIVGAGLPIAVGAAYARAAAGAGAVAVAFFGDGAVATGAFHEATNLAALWRLPLVLFCENNQYSEFSRASDQHPVPISQRARGYGIGYRHVDGNDVEAVAGTMAEVLAHVRSGGGPVLVEALTLRVRGHYEGDPQRYRDGRDEAAVDPLDLAQRRLLARGVPEESVAAAERRATEVVDDAEAFARAAPLPDAAGVLDDVVAPRHPVVEAPLTPDGELQNQSRTLRAALGDALADDGRVFLAGIDVAGGNVFGITRGLAETHPGRVLDTPIAETAIVGLGVGAAMSGLRPVVELMYLDFVGVCLDQLMNQAAKLRFMTGGAVSVPLVLRTQFGSGRSSGSQHSQSLEALLAHLPGLTVVMPSSGPDAYGLLRAAIEDDNPVVFIEHRLLYDQKSPVPPPSHRVPIGKAAVLRPGTDVTVVAWSRMVHHALAAAETLAAEGVEAEVVDLRTIAPLDRETVLASFARTNRMVVAHEAVSDFGVGAEVAALAVDQGFWSLDAPVVRVGARPGPAPYAPVLEHAWEAGPDEIAAAVRRVVAC